MKNEDPKITDLLKKRIEKERKETRAALKADDFLTPKEVAQLFSEHFKLRTLGSWRSDFNDDSELPLEERTMYGPQFTPFGPRRYKYKVQWIWDCLNGLEWEIIRTTRGKQKQQTSSQGTNR